MADDTGEETVGVGDTIQMSIRRDDRFAYLVADSVSVVQANNSVELALISHRIGLDHQLVEVVETKTGLGGRGGKILSGPDVVHIGSVRVSTAGLLELVGLGLEHLQSIGYDEEKVRGKLASLGY